MWLSIIDLLKRKQQRIIRFWKFSLRYYWVIPHKYTKKFGLQTCVNVWIHHTPQKISHAPQNLEVFSWTEMSFFCLSLFQFNKTTAQEQVSCFCVFGDQYFFLFDALCFHSVPLSCCQKKDWPASYSIQSTSICHSFLIM